MEPEDLVEHFNKKYPVGATVRWRSIASDKMPHKEYTVCHPAVVHFGQAVAWFNGKSGMVSIEPKFVDYQ